MGKLVTARKWVQETFEKGSRPKIEQVREWIETKEINGQIIAGVPYVDADAFIVRKPEKRLTGFDLLSMRA